MKTIAGVLAATVALLFVLPTPPARAVQPPAGPFFICVNTTAKPPLPNARVVTSMNACLPFEYFVDLSSPPTPNVVGAWFGIARPCPTDPVKDSPDHAAFCTAVCGLCPNAGILPPEVPLMATLSDDGTLIADDAGEIGLYHTTAHGRWVVSANDGLVDRTGTQRYRGTFLWLGQTPPALGVLGNAVRPRFVTYSDPLDPDRMIGYIQPYFFPIAAGGLVVVNPANPADPLDGNHIPTIDPLVSPLPAGCDLAKGCLGTYHFIIRRVKPE